jgi:APA family basic amino acid/polyamine antiporter
MEGVMSEELAFSRKASGLVRGLSMYDAFGIGFVGMGLTPNFWMVISLGLGVFLGANLIVAVIISFVLSAIGFPLVWGILGGSMPRSGGEYVYNSRILHPIVGMAQSFGDALIWLLWIYVLAPLVVDPGLTSTFQFVGWAAAADWLVSSKWIGFFTASLVSLAAFLVVVFGMRIFARIQRVVITFGIASAVVMILVITFTSRASFVDGWNKMAAANGSVDYNGFISAVGTAVGSAVPATWNWYDTIGVLVAMSFLTAYAYTISYVGGEIKRPDRTIIIANVLSIAVPCALFLWLAAALYNTVGFQFLSASAWADRNGTDLLVNAQGDPVYNMPFSSHIMGLAVVSNQNKLIDLIIGLSYVVFALWWVVLSYLAFPRALFAWGMDRMGPKWFTDINPRFASPVKNHVLCFVLGEILLFIYFVWAPMPMQNLVVAGLQITSVFAVTAVAALLFPYMRRSRSIWQSSPYRGWRFLGLPLVVWGAAVNLAYLGVIMYGFIVMKASDTFTTFGLALMIGAWTAGIIWYFAWRQRDRARGVDSSMTYGELPPE